MTASSLAVQKGGGARVQQFSRWLPAVLGRKKTVACVHTVTVAPVVVNDALAERTAPLALAAVSG